MNRRKFLATSGSLAAVAATPSIAFATVSQAPVAFVPPTTNTISLAGRLAHLYKFEPTDLLKLLDLDSNKIPPPSKEDMSHYSNYADYRDAFTDLYGEQMHEARAIAKNGAITIFKRARMIIDIKQKLNLHFDFSQTAQIEWLDMPNRHLEEMTFRELMLTDLELASNSVEFALQS